MGLYQDWVVPTLIDLSMRNKRLRPYRERVAGAAEGRVLDVGIGSGVNLPLYRQAHEVFGLDPSSRLLPRAHDQAQHTRVPVHLLEGSAESIPLADHSMDTVVMTWTGCSIPDICAALEKYDASSASAGVCCSWSMGALRSLAWRAGRSVSIRSGCDSRGDAT